MATDLYESTSAILGLSRRSRGSNSGGQEGKVWNPQQMDTSLKETTNQQVFFYEQLVFAAILGAVLLDFKGVSRKWPLATGGERL